jgi:uncharacterized protein with von Willebrand factor type A (vWA) domain
MAGPEQRSSNHNGNKQQEDAAGLGDLAQAYRDLARGEQTATALEANLTSLESKLDNILAALDVDLSPPAEAVDGDVKGDGTRESRDSGTTKQQQQSSPPSSSSPSGVADKTKKVD